jgi:prepilin-type N-terminal cleavage/methylation domain-containing protein
LLSQEHQVDFTLDCYALRLGEGLSPIVNEGYQSRLKVGGLAMMFKRPKSALSNQRGFTLVELLMVIAILGVLAAISLQQLKNNREKSFDRQAQAMMRNVLTYAAIDTPQGGDSAGVGTDLAGVGFPEVEIPANVHWSVDNDGDDRWLFKFAHPGGGTGYYFWVPGDTYALSLDTDGFGNRSDKILVNTSYRVDLGLPL